ncbi:hypothetical protein [Ruegeria arenilitoris]|uniref:hypothetical protein n=1 Tax=Ruegeria arenilitoris TaxID=1173585 RepID=UPI00147C6851|nr:hypothetical protein [Ruegeria arenilitoris]
MNWYDHPEVFNFQQVTSEKVIEALEAWQSTLGYNIPLNVVRAILQKHLKKYFWRLLSKLPHERFVVRPTRHRDDFGFSVWLTDFEVVQMNDVLHREIRMALQREYRRSRDEMWSSPGYRPRPLAEGIRTAIAENWCIQMGCTTCGSYRFRLLFLGEPDSVRAIRPKTRLGLERAQEVAAELREFDDSFVQFEYPVMVLLYWIWCEFGERAHEEIFPVLDGSWAGGILEAMRDHHHRRRMQQARHEIERRNAFR